MTERQVGSLALGREHAPLTGPPGMGAPHALQLATVAFAAAGITASPSSAGAAAPCPAVLLASALHKIRDAQPWCGPP